jgi:hypothetical protein
MITVSIPVVCWRVCPIPRGRGPPASCPNRKRTLPGCRWPSTAAPCRRPDRRPPANGCRGALPWPRPNRGTDPDRGAGDGDRLRRCGAGLLDRPPHRWPGRTTHPHRSRPGDHEDAFRAGRRRPACRPEAGALVDRKLRAWVRDVPTAKTRSAPGERGLHHLVLREPPPHGAKGVGRRLVGPATPPPCWPPFATPTSPPHCACRRRHYRRRTTRRHLGPRTVIRISPAPRNRTKVRYDGALTPPIRSMTRNLVGSAGQVVERRCGWSSRGVSPSI